MAVNTAKIHKYFIQIRVNMNMNINIDCKFLDVVGPINALMRGINFFLLNGCKQSYTQPEFALINPVLTTHVKTLDIDL